MMVQCDLLQKYAASNFTSRRMWSFFFFLVLTAIVPEVIAETNSSVLLSPDTFEEMTSGKSVFIKFYAPWCSHSQEIAPKWDRLGKEFPTEEDESVGLIAEVDCTEHEKWCVQLGITGFPTLLYGDPSHGGIFLKEYKSLDRSFQDLLAFAERYLQAPICSPGNIPACNDEMQDKLYHFWNMSETELQSGIAAHEQMIQKAAVNFKDKSEILQQAYDNAAHSYELTAARLKRQVRLLKELQQTIS